MRLELFGRQCGGRIVRLVRRHQTSLPVFSDMHLCGAVWCVVEMQGGGLWRSGGLEGGKGWRRAGVFERGQKLPCVEVLR